MFKLFKKLLGKSEPPPAPTPLVVAPAVPVAADQPVLSGQKPSERPPAPSLATAPRLSVAQVETASLSLAAIISKFPAELQETVANPPDPEVLISLPLASILKQLPSGSVKMSLASVYRQAPRGTFSAPRMEDKQMVEVPLAEIFKRVKPELLKRRTDQRMHELANEEVMDAETSNIFGPSAESAAAQPKAPVSLTPPPSLNQAPLRMSEPLAPLPSAGLKMPPNLGARVTPPPPAGFAPTSAPAEAVPTGEAFVLPLAELSGAWPEEIQAELSAATGADLALPSEEVKAGLSRGKVVFRWGQVRGWISPALPGASEIDPKLELILPLRVVAPAFMKTQKSVERKRVAIDEEIPALFGGGQAAAEPARVAPPVVEAPKPEVKLTFNPEPKAEAPLTFAPEPTKAEVPLTFAPEPIKAEVPLTFAPEPTKSDVPLTFAPERSSEPPLTFAPAPKAEVPLTFAPEPKAEVPLTFAPEPKAEVPLTFAPEPKAEAPLTFAPESKAEVPLTFAPEPKVEAPVAAEVTAPSIFGIPKSPVEEAPAVAKPSIPFPFTAPVEAKVETAVSEVPAPAVPAPVLPAASVGEVLGDSTKDHWSPSEIVTNITRLSQVAGAVVALREGLVVAHSLPEPMKGDVVAAFLPQIFSRLNQYSGEMKLGQIDDLLLRTDGAYFQVFRLGIIYFAVLGKPGETLPGRELRLIADELRRQGKN